MIKYRFLLIFCLVFAMSGCAGNKMALTKGKSDINLTKKSIALLSVRISNQYKPSRQLELLSVVICPQSEPNCKHDLLSNPGSPYKPYKRKKRYFNEYLLSYELESDTYNIDGLYTTYQIPTLTAGFGFAKLNLKTEIKPNSINYLGHLDIVLREKKTDTEIKAGGDIPYIDQSIPGFSSGTFDVVVEDKFDEDMKSFISEYPVLQKVKVEKSILPQWIRPEKEVVVAPKVEEPVTPKEAVVAPNVEKPISPKEAIAATTTPAPAPAPAPETAPAPAPAPVQKKVSITLNVEFDTAKAVVKDNYKNDIKKVADFMKAYPETTVVIEGHTDNVDIFNNPKNNIKLSLARANSVRQYLIDNFGIDASRINDVGYGPDKPIASNDTKKGRQKNRRAQAVIETVQTK
jgi:outer membrane protein OmpA-like peptidoglycan-associated protein